VNVTELPRQNGFVGVAMETLTGRLGLTVIVTALLVAGLLVGQRVSDVKMQVTISPLLGM
jgi:hypothetical protein